MSLFSLQVSNGHDQEIKNWLSESITKIGDLKKNLEKVFDDVPLIPKRSQGQLLARYNQNLSSITDLAVGLIEESSAQSKKGIYMPDRPLPDRKDAAEVFLNIYAKDLPQKNRQDLRLIFSKLGMLPDGQKDLISTSELNNLMRFLENPASSSEEIGALDHLDKRTVESHFSSTFKKFFPNSNVSEEPQAQGRASGKRDYLAALLCSRPVKDHIGAFFDKELKNSFDFEGIKTIILTDKKEKEVEYLTSTELKLIRTFVASDVPKSNIEIGADLNMSKRTVESHLNSIYQKLSPYGVTNRNAFMAVLYDPEIKGALLKEG